MPKLRPPGKRPTGRSGQLGPVKNDAPPPRGEGMSFRNSIAQSQTPPDESCLINQKKRQAGVS